MVPAPSFPPSRNLVEPERFAALFLEHPPRDFVTSTAGQPPVPVFTTVFDLLTTMNQAALARLRQLPFFGLWAKALRFRTCFCGTTITEYTPVPRTMSAQAYIDAVLRAGSTQSLVIVKDIPQQSPLLPPADNAFADALAALASERGFFEVEGQALAWVEIDFADMDEYMARFSASRRKDIRRKLKKRELLEIEAVPLGDSRFADKALLDEMYAMYLEVFAQSEIHFDLLTPEYFAAVLRGCACTGVVLCYRHNGLLAGYNICLVHEGRLIDKYIGLRYPLARELNIYFISWIRNLEYALEHGLTSYVAGWTDPAVKASLGAKFTFTRHLVWVGNPLLRRVLRPFRRFFESDRSVVESL